MTNPTPITGLEGLEPKTRSLWEQQIRTALLGTKKPGKAGPKACSVCGMPDTRNHKGLGGAHLEASMEQYPGKWRMLTKALESKTDFVIKKQFNAQIEFLMGKLLLARMEHEKYEPTTSNNGISNKSQVLGVLTATFKMLSIEIPACPKAKDGKTDRPWSVLQLVEILNLELAKLHGVDSDVTVSEHPAEDEPEDKQEGTGEKASEGAAVSGEQQATVNVEPPTPVEEPTAALAALEAVKAGSNGTLTM